MSPAKALAIAVYGESVAAYRYRLLAERAIKDVHKAVFTEMADEEQEHHELMQQLMAKHFPDDDFVLREEEKQLVIVGHRMIEAHTPNQFREAIDTLYNSEQRTGGFYGWLAGRFPDGEVQTLLKEMSDECFEHAERLREIPPP